MKFINNLYTEEYACEAVPESERKHWIQVAAVWMGFTMAASLAVLGGIVQGGVGVGNGMIAIIAGNSLLFIYATLLGFISFKTGLNFHLVAKRSFGTKGYIFASFLLSSLVLGWFAVQADMFGALLHITLLESVPRWGITFVAAILFMLTALVGYKAMVLLSYLVIPSFLALGVWASWEVFTQTGLSIDMAIPEGSTMGLGTAISIVAASFIVSATMTGDFVRWARSFKDIVIVHFLAFIVGLGATMLFGLFLSAAGNETDIFTTLVVLGLAIPGAIMTGLNLWSTCDNCLYNASIGFTNQLSTLVGREITEKKVVLMLGLLGAILASAGAYNNYESWLLLLGTIVPPIGGIVMTDFYLSFKDDSNRYEVDYTLLPSIKYHAIISWALGTGVAYFAEKLFASIPAAYVGVFVGGLSYYILSKVISEMPTKNIAFGESYEK